MYASVRRYWKPAGTLALIGAGCAALLPPPQPAHATAPSTDDIRAMLADRSPGARGAGALYQTKPGFAETGAGPTERVLGESRSYPAGPADGAAPGAPGLAEPIPGLPGAADPGGEVAEGGPVGIGPSFAAIGNPLPPTGGLAAPGGGGGGGGGETTTPVTPPPATPALPEPATWLSMIVGFAAIGVAQRRGVQPARKAC